MRRMRDVAEVERLRRHEIALGLAALALFASALALSALLKPPNVPRDIPDALPWSALRAAEPDHGREVTANIADLRDDDPRAARLLAELTARGNTAAVNPTLDGTRVTLSGFAVPLDAEAGRVGAFLLVPYYGACIHVPPPPANQVVLVTPAHLRRLDSMDPVIVRGVLHVSTTPSRYGASGYRIEQAAVDTR